MLIVRSSGRISACCSTAKIARSKDLGRRARVFLAPGDDGRFPCAYFCIKGFSETDFTDDLRKIDVPTLILHGDDDQIVPIGASAPLSSKLIRGSTLKICPGAPHGMCTTLKDQVNADLLAFIKRVTDHLTRWNSSSTRSFTIFRKISVLSFGVIRPEADE